MLFWYFYDTCPIFAETILPTSKVLSSCNFPLIFNVSQNRSPSSDVGKMTRLLFFSIESQITTQYCYIKHYVYTVLPLLQAAASNFFEDVFA